MPQMLLDITGIVFEEEKKQVTKKIGASFPTAKVDFKGVRADKIDVMVTNHDGDFADLESRLRSILRDCNFSRCKIYPAVVAIKGRAPIA